MEMIPLDKIKEVQVDMLLEIDAFCKKYELTYYLTGGTLLGSIRHKGYIPWDDDIDILMPRHDYQRLLKIFDDNNRVDVLKLIHINNTVGYIRPYAKLIRTDTIVKEFVDSNLLTGLWIDIFPLDNMSDNYEKAVKLFREVKHYRNLLEIKNIKISKGRSILKNTFLLISKFLLAPISRDRLIKKIDIISRKYESEEMTQFVSVVSVGTYGLKEIMDSQNYKDTIDVEFEHNYFKSPKGYHAILTNLYNNYMELPPVSKRITHHNYQAWWK